ncbi:MAG TPA: hypothetical protein VMT38_12040 [Terracidiphilus sp.]|nr:hypothetical protein [Terracidiphilus sp.]
MASPRSSYVSPVTANEFVEQQLHYRLEALEGIFQAHALSFSGPILLGVDDPLRIAAEKRCIQATPSDRLIIVLTTGGGYMDPVQRMVATLRRHYKIVDFIIPNYAYSAGTIFTLSGDSIYMDYYSRLGPIDPQIQSAKGLPVSALGYLEKYNDLLKRAARNRISTTEIQILLSFDQGELYFYEQQRDLAITALKEWLVKYKFKDWKVTQTRKRRVTQKMKEDAATKIGKVLNDTKKWHSHGYGISMEVLRRDLNLKVEDFGAQIAHSDAIRSYYDLLSDYMVKRDYRGVIHTSKSFVPFA